MWNPARLCTAEYVEYSKTLQTLDLEYYGSNSHETFDNISIVVRALSRNTSVTKLIIHTETIRFASMAFQKLLTCTQTLKKLELFILGTKHSMKCR